VRKRILWNGAAVLVLQRAVLRDNYHAEKTWRNGMCLVTGVSSESLAAKCFKSLNENDVFVSLCVCVCVCVCVCGFLFACFFTHTEHFGHSHKSRNKWRTFFFLNTDDTIFFFSSFTLRYTGNDLLKHSRHNQS